MVEVESRSWYRLTDAGRWYDVVPAYPHSFIRFPRHFLTSTVRHVHFLPPRS